jgi:dTDP-4-dehydrorhamnose 3,5-epimerase
MRTPANRPEQNDATRETLLDKTLRAAVKDRQMVTPEGGSVSVMTEGVKFRPAPVHTDERGMLVEIYDPRWKWHPDPLVFVYALTLRPGFVKGWNLHKHHEDRYFILQGEMEIVLYDVRPESPTYGQISRIVLSENNRGLVNIPTHVWHADHNIGARDVIVVNCPTQAYDHANPDKYRLPIDTPLIPHTFPGARGW